MRAETKITDKRTKKMAKNFHEQRPEILEKNHNFTSLQNNLLPFLEN